eukprot:2272311-Pyramimonas_sp.AAC.1
MSRSAAPVSRAALTVPKYLLGAAAQAMLLQKKASMLKLKKEKDKESGNESEDDSDDGDYESDDSDFSMFSSQAQSRPTSGKFRSSSKRSFQGRPGKEPAGKLKEVEETGAGPSGASFQGRPGKQPAGEIEEVEETLGLVLGGASGWNEVGQSSPRTIKPLPLSPTTPPTEPRPKSGGSVRSNKVAPLEDPSAPPVPLPSGAGDVPAQEDP